MLETVFGKRPCTVIIVMLRARGIETQWESHDVNFVTSGRLTAASPSKRVELYDSP